MENMTEKARLGLVLNHLEQRKLAEELRRAIRGAQRMGQRAGECVTDARTAATAAKINDALHGAIEIMDEIATAAETGRWWKFLPDDVVWDLDAAAARIRRAEELTARLPCWDDAKK